MRHNFVFIFLLFLVFSLPVKAQFQLEFSFPEYTRNGVNYARAFNGGLNSPQYQDLDFDFDGDLDLVVFERSSDMILCFENKGDDYVFKPIFSSFFPQDIQHWMVLADYDCDGKNDLFTYSTSGVRVFQNVSTNNTLAWELIADPLLTEGLSGPVNILFNPSDIPSIEDQDQDGDLDFLFFNFTDGDHIEFHKNISIEQTGSCGLELVRESLQYGEIDVCECDEFSFQGESCHDRSKTLHVAGKALLSYDHLSNSALDLVISQEECPNLSFLSNSGNPKDPIFESSTNTFPTFSGPIEMPTFPAAYYLDVTFDGQKDLIVAQNVRENHHNSVDFKNSSLLFSNHGENEFVSNGPFLQDEMIDVGAIVYPSFADINGDGVDDLVLSNEEGNLTCFLQTAYGFEFYSEDLFNFSYLGFVELKVQFIELNDDDKMDMAIGVHTHIGHVNFFYYFLNKSENGGIEIDINDPQSFNYTLDRTDDFFLHDMDNDGSIDLLVANVFGELNYYRNEGMGYNFVLATMNVLETEQTAENSNLSISLGDLNSDGKSDLITTRRNGITGVYFDFPTNTTEFQEDLIYYESNYENETTHFGRKSKPAVGHYFGNQVITIGTLQGGIFMLNTRQVSNESEVFLDAFPNPSINNTINFKLSEGMGQLQILDLSGRPVSSAFEVGYNSMLTLDLSFLTPGLYIASVLTQGNSVSQRIKIIGD
ncbi:MAG: T9SS type A sorting domain-containing protein [Reichenbachiella sp.]